MKRPTHNSHRHLLRWWQLPLLLAITGCSTGHSMTSAQSAVEAIARFELECDQLQLVELGEATQLFGTYDQILGARGCGRRVVYLVSCANDLCAVEVE